MAIHPVAQLLDDLKGDDLEQRISAMHRIGTIAVALGSERSKVELIPFLNECTKLLFFA